MFSRTITSHLPSSSSSTASTLSRSILSIPCTCSHATSSSSRSRLFATSASASNSSSTPKSTSSTSSSSSSSSSTSSTVSPTVAASLPRTYRPRPDKFTPIQRTYDRHWDDPWRDPPKEPFRSKKHPLHFDNRPVFPRDRHTRHGQGDARTNPQPEIIPDPELAPGTDEKEWKIHTAMIIERMPVVYATPEPWQLEWERFQTSRKQKTRIILPEELLTKKRDGEDEELPEEFIPGPTETKDDKENNIRSMNRCLRTSLFLLVKKPDAQFPWSFCEAPHDYTAKHLRASAEAAMRRDIGKNLGVHIMGNAPFGHHSYEFDEERLETSEGRKGAKVFYMHALWLDGDVEIDMKNVIDYAWVPKARLHEYLAPEECAVMKKILLGYD